VSGDAWLALGITISCFGLLASNRFAPDTVMMGGLTLLLLSGVLAPQEALAGFANEGMVTVGVLYIVVTGVRETGGIEWIVQSVLGNPRSLINAQVKLMLPVAAISAFLNNTPVVAMFIPAVQEWAKRHQLSVSKLMIPLSYAAIAGGTCTLIGTTTNLVVNGLVLSKTELPPLGIFDIAWVGVPTALVVIVCTVLFGQWLLPERRASIKDYTDAREFTVEMIVEPGSPLEGKTIEGAGLRQLPGLYLIEIDREGRVLPAVSPKEPLRSGDRLVFAGVVESIVDLQRIRGLKPATDQVFKLDAPKSMRCLTEAVVSNTSPLVGKSVREGRFRTHYNAAIIAVARNGEKINKKIGDIVLRPGDTLLLECRPSFVEQHRNSRDFFLVSRLDEARPRRHDRALVAVAIIGGMVLVVALGWLSMLKAAMLAAGLMIITRCTTGSIARRAVDLQVLVVIAAAFGIGTALQSTGAAAALAQSLILLAEGTSWLVLSMVYLTTALLTALVTNNAAAVIMFPIALASAEGLGVSFLPFVMTVMMGASASFATPIGYQTNLMVYGAGGYRFTDYLRIGLPLTLVVGATTVVIVQLVWPLK
jgi:di/tricarboxylate transporter